MAIVIRKIVTLWISFILMSPHSAKIIAFSEAGNVKTTALVVAGGIATTGVVLATLGRRALHPIYNLWSVAKVSKPPSLASQIPSPQQEDILLPRGPFRRGPLPPEIAKVLEEAANKTVLKQILADTLPTEKVLLYDYNDNPILKSDPVWETADAKAREFIEKHLSEAAEKADSSVNLPTRGFREKLKSVLGKILAASGLTAISRFVLDYEFDRESGKLKISFKIGTGKIILAEVNVYNLIDKIKPTASVVGQKKE